MVGIHPYKSRGGEGVKNKTLKLRGISSSGRNIVDGERGKGVKELELGEELAKQEGMRIAKIKDSKKE